MGHRVLAVAIVGSLSLAVVVACGASGSSDDGSSGGSSSGASGTLGSSGASDDGGGDLGGCGYESHSAQATPLDLVFLLDASGSMNESPGGGASKWQTVKAAIGSFAQDPKSVGIGAGLLIFPVQHAGAPSSCTSSAQCNTGTNYGKCTLHACHQQNRNDPYIFCDTAADCPGSVPCREFGACSDPATNAPSEYCEPDDPQGSTCAKSGDNCLPYATGVCSLDECFASDYATPKAPIAPLPGTFVATVGALPDPDQNNATPTSMAIKSGIDLATAYGKANAGHSLALVLATDGLPTRCDPQDIPGLSALLAAALAGAPSVKTFVVGVFTPTEATQAQANLDALASAGGSSKSFIVNAAGNLGADFQAALATVRGQALPCEYTIPPPNGGGAQDFGKVNVEYTSGTGMKNVLGYKTSMSMCGADGGWYYDVDPSSGTPTKILICPASCDTLKADTGAAKLDILLGCKTVIK